jgi:hypothetical protein
MVVPVPRSFLSDKGDDGFRQNSRFGIYNSLDPDLPVQTEEHRYEWKPYRESLMVLDRQGMPVELWTVPSAVGMHVSLSHVRQTSRLGQLYSREELAPETNYVAWVMDPEDVLGDFPPEIVIGKRRSAGNGLASVTASSVGAVPWPRYAQPKPGEARIQLLTDAILPGASGGYLRGLDDVSLTRLLKVPARIVRTASAFRSIPGWSGAWGMPREQALAVSAGSVWLICSDDPGFAAALARLEREGIGIRRGEGFGWVVMNPEWVYFGGGRKGAVPPHKGFQTETAPIAFPGVETIDRSELQWLMGEARRVAEAPETQLRGAAQYALRVDDPVRLEAFLKQMAERSNSRDWEKVRDALQQVFDKAKKERIAAATRIEGVRFLLDAALVYKHA